MEGNTSQNPVTTSDDSDDNGSATNGACNTQSTSKGKGKASAADMDYVAPVILVCDGCYRQTTVNTGYSDDIKPRIHMLSPGLFPKAPCVSFDGIISGSGETLLKEKVLTPERRKFCGFVQLSTYLDPGRPGATFQKGLHGFSVFLIIPITEAPFAQRYRTLAQSPQTPFQRNRRFACSMGSVVGVLPRHVMVNPPTGITDMVLMVVPEDPDFHFGARATVDVLNNWTGVDSTSRAKSGRSRFLTPSKNSSSQASGAADNGATSSSDSPSSSQLPSTPQRSFGSAPTSSQTSIDTLFVAGEDFNPLQSRSRTASVSSAQSPTDEGARDNHNQQGPSTPSPAGRSLQNQTRPAGSSTPHRSGREGMLPSNRQCILPENPADAIAQQKRDFSGLINRVLTGLFQPHYCESSHAQHHCISANRAIRHANVAGVSNNAISEGRHEVPSSIAASMCSRASPQQAKLNSLTMVHLAVY
ncbi:hypothetical protein CGCTS75_v002815 [Colletotrichum tropicale]|nr:hypothetical protein CGCTS75_v002815 [Colletotrichum tropicale]